jgi:hypothetical protein
MRPLSRDTHHDIEKVHIELLRKAPISKRFAIVCAWSQFIREAAKQGIRRDHPSANEEEVNLILLERLYGQTLAEKVRRELIRRRQQ